MSLFKVRGPNAGGDKQGEIALEGGSVRQESFIVAGAQYAEAVVGFATNLFAAHWLGPVDYGLASMAVALPSMVWSFASVKSTDIATRYLSDRNSFSSGNAGAVCRLTYLVDLVAAVSAVVIVIGCVLLGDHIIPMLRASWLAVAYAASFPVGSLAGTSASVLTATQRLKLVSAAQFAEKALGLILALLSAAAGFGLAGFVLSVAVANAAYSAFLYLAARRALAERGVHRIWRLPREATPANFAGLSELRRLLGWTYVMSTLTGAMAQLPIMLLGSARGPAAAGYLRLAVALSTGLSYTGHAVGRVVYPRLSAAWHDGRRHELVGLLVRWSCTLGISAALPAALAIPLAPWIIPLFFGARYNPVIPGLQLLCGSVVVACVLFWGSALFYAAGRVRDWTTVFGVQSVAVLATLLLLGAKLDFVTAAGVMAIGRSLFLIATAIMARGILTSDRHRVTEPVRQVTL